MISIIVSALLGLLVAYAAFGNGRFRQNLSAIKTYRLRHFVGNLLIIPLVLGTGILLSKYVPFMDKNPILWVLSKLFGWGNGNGGANLGFIGIQWKWYAVIFLPLLIFALPTYAKSEEESYRAGTRNWGHGIIRSVRFGLAHLIMLIPLGMALALSIGGLWFTHHYFKGGIERSTTYHAVYNSMLIGSLLGLVLLS